MNEDLILARLANNIIDYTIQTRELGRQIETIETRGIKLGEDIKR